MCAIRQAHKQTNKLRGKISCFAKVALERKLSRRRYLEQKHYGCVNASSGKKHQIFMIKALGLLRRLWLTYVTESCQAFFCLLGSKQIRKLWNQIFFLSYRFWWCLQSALNQYYDVLKRNDSMSEASVKHFNVLVVTSCSTYPLEARTNAMFSFTVTVGFSSHPHHVSSWHENVIN